MAGEKVLWSDGFIAGANLTEKRYYAVKMSGEKVVLAGAGESAVGIVMVGDGENKIVRVAQLGVAYAIAGDTIVAGANLTPDANGKLVTAGAGDAVIAVARQNAAAGDIFEADLVIRANAGTTGIAKSYCFASFPVSLADADDKDLVTDFIPGFVGKIVGISYIAQVPATTPDKTASISLEIGTEAVTGGVIDLTTAKANTLGKITEGTAITAKNVLAANSKISIVAADTAAAFTEGSGTIVVKFEIN